jgi:hypothetical protein
MKNAIVRTARRLKNHVRAHKGFYGMGAVATAAVLLQQKNLNDTYAFLESKDIDPMEFYFPELYEEIKKNS